MPPDVPVSSFNKWLLPSGRIIYLLTPEEVVALPTGVTLISINGNIKIKGIDKIDFDIRYGYTSWAVMAASGWEQMKDFPGMEVATIDLPETIVEPVDPFEEQIEELIW
jgi:hypothetical protein